MCVCRDMKYAVAPHQGRRDATCTRAKSPGASLPKNL